MPNYPEKPEKYPEVARAMATVYELEDLNELVYSIALHLDTLQETLESCEALLASIEASQT